MSRTMLRASGTAIPPTISRASSLGPRTLPFSYVQNGRRQEAVVLTSQPTKQWTPPGTEPQPRVWSVFLSISGRLADSQFSRPTNTDFPEVPEPAVLNQSAVRRTETRGHRRRSSKRGGQQAERR